MYPGRQIAVQSLLTGERRVLIEDGGQVKYVATGHLVYVRSGTLLAVPFDVEELAVAPGPVPLIEGISEGGNFVSQVDISDTGSLVYVPSGSGAVRTLVWVDRQGREEPVPAEPGDYGSPDVSPDGGRLAFVDAGDIWTYDLARDTATPLTFDPAFDGQPRWSPDGRRVVFVSFREGANDNLFWTPADGTGDVARLTTNPRNQIATSWSSDGQHVLFDECGVGCDLGVLSLEGAQTAELLLETEFEERNAALSPNGRWIAYESDLSGAFEVYVRPFPDVDGTRQQVSTQGGLKPQWGSDGRELFYRSPAGLMVVPVETQAAFMPGDPQVLFDLEPYWAGPGRGYALAPGGDRFLMIKQGAQTGDNLPQVIVVQNWIEELKRLVPVN